MANKPPAVSSEELVAMLPWRSFDVTDASLYWEVGEACANAYILRLCNEGLLNLLTKRKGGTRVFGKPGVVLSPPVTVKMHKQPHDKQHAIKDALGHWQHLSPILRRQKRIRYSDVREILPRTYIAAINACVEHCLLRHDGLGFVPGEMTAGQLKAIARDQESEKAHKAALRERKRS